MKLRLQSNSIRFRLKQGEVTQIAKSHRVEESVAMGVGRDDAFLYVLEASDEVGDPQVKLQPRGLLVRLSVQAVRQWAEGSEVGIEAILAVEGGELRLLIEKDFACLHGPSEENVDTFPHPLAEAGAEG